MAISLERLSINQATTREQWDFAQSVEGYARHGVAGIAVMHEKLREVGASAGARLIRDAGLKVSGYNVASDFSEADGPGRREMMADNRRKVDEAAEIGAPCLVAIGGGISAEDKDIGSARRRSFDAFAELLPDARAAGVTLALEPLHPMVCSLRSVLSTMAQANDWCGRLGDGAGLAVDTYNVWWDPQLEAEIARARGRIAVYHVVDWLADTCHLRFDRGMPGDGLIDLPRLRGCVEEAGYTGLVEVEVISERWGKRDAEEVVNTVVERCLSGAF